MVTRVMFRQGDDNHSHVNDDIDGGDDDQRAMDDDDEPLP